MGLQIIGSIIVGLLISILLSTIRITMYIESTNMRLQNIENKINN